MTSFVRIRTIEDSGFLSKTLEITQSSLQILFQIFDDRYTTTAVNLDDVFGILLTILLYFCGHELHSIFQREYLYDINWYNSLNFALLLLYK